MTRAVFALLAVLALLWAPEQVLAQTQRLGVLPGTVLKLGAKGTAGSARVAPCYCLDQTLPTPKLGSRLHQLSRDNRTVFVKIGTEERVPWQAAVASGQVEVKYSNHPETGLGLEVINNTNQPIEIHFEKSTLFSDDARRGVEGIDLEALKHGPEAQKRIWEAMFAARLDPTLRAAGRATSFDDLEKMARKSGDIQITDKYLSPGLISLARTGRTRADTLVLMRASEGVDGLRLYRVSNGMSALAARGVEAAVRMAGELPDAALYRGVKNALPELVTFHKEDEVTFALTRTDVDVLWRVVGGRVEQVERGPKAIFRLLSRLRTPADFERLGRERTGVLTFYREGADLFVLTGGELQDIELHRVRGDQIERVSQGPDALARVVARYTSPAELDHVDGLPRELLSFFRDRADTLVLLRVEGEVELRRVRGDTVETIQKEEDAITYLDNVVQKLAESKDGDPNAPVLLHIPSAAAAGWGGGNLPPGKSPPGASGWPEPEGFSFHFGKKSVPLSRAQLVAFLKGEDIDPNLDKTLKDAIGNKKDVVIMQDAFARGAHLSRDDSREPFYHWSRVHLDPGRVTLELQRRYPDKRFYLDDPDAPGMLDATLSRVATLYKVGGPKDVAMIYDPSMSFQDFGVYQTVQPFLDVFHLPQHPISLADAVNGKPGAVPESNLVVLSGHKDGRFRTYVDRLSRSGVFKDKVVALFSCYEQDEEGFNSRLLARESGAKAVLYFTVRIDNEAAVRVLQSLSEQIDAVGKANPAEKPDLKILLDEAIDTVLKDPGLPEADKEKVRQMRKAVIQVSDARQVDPLSGPRVG